MICRNCQADVDDDLIFCTNCGARLYETNQSVTNETVTQIAQPRPKKSSNLKWVALIVALITVPAAFLGAYLLMRKPNAPTVVQNTAKPTATRKPAVNTSTTNSANNSSVSDDTNQNTVSNSEQTNDNQNENADNDDGEVTEILEEQTEIAPGEHVAYPFKLTGDAKLVGDVQTLRGKPVQGYLYLQTQYDEHFPDPTYKVSSFGGDNPQFKQVLVSGDYVLVFLNENKTPSIIKAQFSSTPFSFSSK